MSLTLVKNATVVLKGSLLKSASIGIQDGLIAAVGRDLQVHGADVVDAEHLSVLPGFIDIHIHGAVGVDVNEAGVDGLLEIAGFLGRNGVTAWVPTVVPDSDENYRKVIDAIDRLMEIQVDRPVAQAVGVHYEGVFANEKMCGALRPEFFKSFRDVSRDFVVDNKNGTTNLHKKARISSSTLSILGLPELKSGVHMTTFAPEIDGGVELAAELTRQGWIASIGHTRADVGTLDRAFAAGATHVTHFFNAMTGIHHRDVGVAGWAVTNDNVTFDIIADGFHVHPKMLEFACRRKSPDRSVLISDSVAPTGLGDGSFELWGETITVENGRTKNERGSIAGSVITMLDAVNRMRSLGFADDEVAKMSSENPARLLGLDDRGSIAIGKRADIVGLDDEGNVKLVMIGGKSVELTGAKS